MARLWMNRGDADAFVERGEIRLGREITQNWAALADRAAIAQAMVTSGYASPRAAASGAGQLDRFSRQMAVGDRVLTYDKSRRIYHVGQIDGSCRFDPQDDPAVGNFVRKVSWQGEVPRDVLSTPARNTLGSLMTVFEPDEVVAAEIDAVLRGEMPAPTAIAAKSSPVGRPTTASIGLIDVSAADDAAALDLIRRDVDSRAHELIKDRIARLDWQELQELVAAILRAMGYKTRVSAPGSDRGRDIVASPDGLGLEPPRIKVEVKHRQVAMGAPDVRKFLGGLRSDDRGLYVSTGGFSREAHYEAERSTVPISLLDLDDVAELLVQHYDAVDADGRALVPLKRVFFPA